MTDKQPPVPEDDLGAYAQARGLDHRGNRSQVGWLAAFPMSEELQFNVLRGPLPGGEHGIVFHEAKVIEGERFGAHHATQFAGPRERFGMRLRLRDALPLGDLLGSDLPLFKFPHTTVAVRIPQASGLVLGLQAARDAEVAKPGSAAWTEVDEPLRGWWIAARRRADEDTVAHLVGPLTELLSQSQPLGFQLAYRFGTLVVSQAHYEYDPAQLDALCAKASWLAGAIRTTCEQRAQQLDFATELGEPFWMEEVRSKPGEERIEGSDGQNIGSVVRLARETGMALEDPYAFMRGFGDVPFPGEVYGLLRGTLPGSDVHGRVAVAIERSGYVNTRVQKALTEKMGGPFGCDTVLVAVDPQTPETAGTDGEPWIERGRVAVRRGILAAWRAREGNPVQRHEVEQLVADTLDAARARTTIC